MGGDQFFTYILSSKALELPQHVQKLQFALKRKFRDSLALLQGEEIHVFSNRVTRRKMGKPEVKKTRGGKH